MFVTYRPKQARAFFARTIALIPSNIAELTIDVSREIDVTPLLTSRRSKGLRSKVVTYFLVLGGGITYTFRVLPTALTTLATLVYTKTSDVSDLGPGCIKS